MLTGVDYGPRAFPLPFAYPTGRIPDHVTEERTQNVFWSGNKLFGLRKLYTDWLAEVRGIDFDQRYTRKQYIQRLARSRIGLDFFGLGFDTVRYWELPAHGCMLLAERRPIRIPYDFEDWKSAVFFDDLPDVEDKLSYYEAHPAQVTEIALAGHEHLKRHHTNTARARQMLAQVEACVEYPALTLQAGGGRPDARV